MEPVTPVRNPRSRTAGPVAAGIFLICLLVFACSPEDSQNSGTAAKRGSKQNGFDVPGVPVVAMVPGNFSELVKHTGPAVVNIQGMASDGDGRFSRFFGDGPDNPMRDFFERFFGAPGEEGLQQRSLGSGFIVDRGGYIVTNQHVIADADRIRVTLADERQFDAVVVGADPQTDLALIRIDADSDLPALALGNSDATRVGQWVVAIGNPFGLQHTVTKGIISAKGRVIGSGPYDDFIQTDASINPGNSGGPLIDLGGRVIGINTAIVAGGTGIGFAIPANLAKGILEQLRSGGKVTRGWIGVVIQNLRQETAEYYGVDADEGVLVVEVVSGDPAQRAGILAGDIITEIEGRSVDSSRTLVRLIAEQTIGETIDVQVLRNGEKKHFSVSVAKREQARN
ncbi:MAG TPA: trypsin-like peptidase domain-containing protein [Desulfobacterales bacterium]